MRRLWGMSERRTPEEVAQRLKTDGYPVELAEKVRTAYRAGRLLWTTDHLVITGEGGGTWLPAKRKTMERQG